jgi:tRNA G37 N-methylase TrmD
VAVEWGVVDGACYGGGDGVLMNQSTISRMEDQRSHDFKPQLKTISYDGSSLACSVYRYTLYTRKQR